MHGHSLLLGRPAAAPGHPAATLGSLPATCNRLPATLGSFPVAVLHLTRRAQALHGKAAGGLEQLRSHQLVVEDRVLIQPCDRTVVRRQHVPRARLHINVHEARHAVHRCQHARAASVRALVEPRRKRQRQALANAVLVHVHGRVCGRADRQLQTRPDRQVWEAGVQPAQPRGRVVVPEHILVAHVQRVGEPRRDVVSGRRAVGGWQHHHVRLRQLVACELEPAVVQEFKYVGLGGGRRVGWVRAPAHLVHAQRPVKRVAQHDDDERVVRRRAARLPRQLQRVLVVAEAVRHLHAALVHALTEQLHHEVRAMVAFPDDAHKADARVVRSHAALQPRLPDNDGGGSAVFGAARDCRRPRPVAGRRGRRAPCRRAYRAPCRRARTPCTPCGRPCGTPSRRHAPCAMRLAWHAGAHAAAGTRAPPRPASPATLPRWHRQASGRGAASVGRTAVGASGRRPSGR
eukprot:351138-Chlamydomonas_euryale.AAC.16